MENQSHILVNDGCDNCRYVINAFTLLRLPLKVIPYPDILEQNSTISSLSIIVCKNIESQNSQKLHDSFKQRKLRFISFHSTSKQADGYFLKMPFSKYELKNAISYCSDPDNLLNNYPSFSKLVGKSPSIVNIKKLISQVANSDTTVLIMGQSGTGKDVIASCIHQISSRKTKLLVPVNCGAIPGELMESELFGHEKGAFTGAFTRRVGRFELANEGTLFLDEIGDMPLPMQVKLLRVIQDKTIDRLGSATSIKVDVRLIAATNQKLEQLIKQNNFREDLFYRINVFPIQVPTLSERREDIPFIIDYHLDKIYERLKHRVVFTERAIEILSEFAWPGNIRELANFLERMVILHPDQVVDEKEISKFYNQNALCPSILSFQTEKSFNIKDYMSAMEQHIIKIALEKSNGIINAAAEYLSIGRSTLIEKMRKYNLGPLVN